MVAKMKKKTISVTENKVARGSTQEQKLMMKDGVYLRQRKRVYLYWFKFLQEAEKSSSHKVDWRKYKGWGGANEVMGSKFDDWWTTHWKELFGVKKKNGTPKFNVKDSIYREYEDIRLTHLVYTMRDTPIDYIEKHKVRYHGYSQGRKRKRVNPRKPVITNIARTNYLSIAYKIYQTESSKKRWTPVAHLDPDDTTADHTEIKKIIRSMLKKGEQIMSNVCEGHFP
jgi:hypothetical protein